MENITKQDLYDFYNTLDSYKEDVKNNVFTNETRKNIKKGLEMYEGYSDHMNDYYHYMYIFIIAILIIFIIFSIISKKQDKDEKQVYK
jgi:hypothetical protein